MRSRPLAASPWLALALALAIVASCAPRPQIVSPADQSSIALDGSTNLHIRLGTAIQAPGTHRVTLLRGIDAQPAEAIDLTARFPVSGADVLGTLAAEDLAPGRNVISVSIDTDGDGRPENVMSSVFRWDPLRAAACKRTITPVAGVSRASLEFFLYDRPSTRTRDPLPGFKRSFKPSCTRRTTWSTSSLRVRR